MSRIVKIGVDGDDGAEVARNPGIRIVSDNQAVVPYTNTEHGADGQNARLAIRGAPAGFLAVELSESNVIPEGIHARVVTYASRQQPPESTVIPARTDVLFTAIGGDGEKGRVGIDGQRGKNGVDGVRATRTSDATPGSNGGDGGNAGAGTNGADGGDGGAIEIHLDEDDTHLLFATEWDLRGGRGGAPGKHGRPGKGGLGGRGGGGITWQELLGYRFDYTTIGREVARTIVVNMRDNTQRTYGSKFNLELVDFEVEDANGDGVLEPGEFAYIKRIRVRNSGGMLSPTSRIPITLKPSTWFRPVNSAESQALIPPSIGVGEVATLSEDLKVFIRTNEIPPPSGTQFSEQDTLSVSAHMPWLNRALPHFEYSQIIDIQYPVALQRFDYLKSLAQGSESRFQFEVYNKSVRALGSEAHIARTVEVISSTDGEFGHLRSNAGDWQEQVAHDVPHISPLDKAVQSQRIKILPDAQSYRHINIEVGLYLAVPVHNRRVGGIVQEEKSLIQSDTLRVQVASHHKYNADSAFLLVLTSDSTKECVQAIKGFIETDLKMQVDEWNISLYGGLQFAAEEDQAQSMDVIVLYQGKTIIFLGEKFEFFGEQNRNVAEFCDVRVLAEACGYGTTCLFLGSSQEKSLDSLFRNLAFPIRSQMTDAAKGMKESQKFFSKQAFIDSIVQSKLGDLPHIHLSAVPMPGRWYRLGNSNPRSEAKKLAGYLLQRLPQERFLIAPAKGIGISRQGADVQHAAGNKEASRDSRKKHSTKDRGALIILHGCPHEVSAIATEPSLAEYPKFFKPSSHYLPHFDALMLVRSLPFSHRIEILWDLSIPKGAALDGQLSDEAILCVFFSVLIEVDREMQIFLSRSTWPNRITFPKDPQSNRAFAQRHLPVLSRLLQPPEDPCPITPPQQIAEILQYAEASTLPQKKRHIARTTLMPFAQRRRQTRQFLRSLFDSVLLQRSSYTKEDCSKLHREVKALHSYTDGQKRKTSTLILNRVGGFTRRTDHQHRMAHCTASTVVPRTTYCSASQWDERLNSIERDRALIIKETLHAREIWGRMIVDAPSGDED